MASTSETGHAKNAANFEDLISFCTGYGASYNPNKASIKLPALNTLFTSAKNSLDTLTAASPAYTNAVNSREIAFEPLSRLVTRIINSLDSSDVPAQTVADAKTYARKIQGKRAKPKQQDDPNTPEDESQNSISASQMSYDNRIFNFNKLIQLLASQPAYAPNEADLTTASLSALYTTLNTLNTTVVNTFTPISNARIARDTILYTQTTGLVDIAADVKKYIKSVFGAASPQYKQISGIKFKKPKS